jgi:hypothetical protein
MEPEGKGQLFSGRFQQELIVRVIFNDEDMFRFFHHHPHPGKTNKNRRRANDKHRRHLACIIQAT